MGQGLAGIGVWMGRRAVGGTRQKRRGRDSWLGNLTGWLAGWLVGKLTRWVHMRCQAGQLPQAAALCVAKLRLPAGKAGSSQARECQVGG